MPTTDIPAAADGRPARFPSVAAIREAHAALVGRDPPPTGEEVVALIARVRVSGAVLGTRAERTEAQNVINYWANVLYSTPAVGTVGVTSGGAADVRVLGAGRELDAAETVLDPFVPSAAPELPDAANPFKGLAAFGPADAGRFFGRDEARASLVERVLEHPVVVVSGPSGAGKSSLVLAGLIPALRSVNPRMRSPLIVTPGADPLGALVALARSAAPHAPELTAAALRADPGALRARLFGRGGNLSESVEPSATGGAPIGAFSPGPTPVIVDQFEEVFTLCDSPPDREAFAAAVVGLAAESDNRVVLTVREDYAEQTFHLSALKALPADAKFSPPPMSLRELRRVVERPAELIGLKFDDGIAEELVKEVVGEPTALPLLQFALTRLWEKRERDRITWAAYRAIGRPREALQRKAEEIYTALPEGTDKDAARLVFLDLLRPTVGVEVVRKRVRREALRQHAASNRVDDLLKRFADAGLLRVTPGADAGDDLFEVVHEALIRNWARLADWLKEKRERSEKELQVAATARLWADSGRADGYLLTGTALDEAAAFAGASSDVAELVRASRHRQQRWRRLTRWAVTGTLAALAAGCLLLGWLLWYAVSARREVEATQSQREKKRRVANMQTLVRVTAEAVTAQPGAWQEVAYNRWETVTHEFTEDEKARPPADQYFTNLLKGTFPEGIRARAADREAAGKDALGLARQLRNEMIAKDDPEIRAEMDAGRRLAYERVRFSTDHMVRSFDALPYGEARAYVREFWVHYWGELGMFEGPRVERAMARFGQQLDAIKDKVPKTALADGGHSLSVNLSDPKRSTAFLIRLTLNSGSLNGVADTFRDFAQMVHPADARELHARRAELHAALDAELSDPRVREYTR